MSELNFSTLFNPGQKFIQDAYSQSRGDQLGQHLILHTGIVLDILREVNFDTVSSLSLPQYSIKAKVIGEDISVVSNTNDLSLENNKWYVPLMPVTNISLPEVGEEILIIRENTSVDSKGYWIGRPNNTPFTNASLPQEATNSTSLLTTGFNIDIDELHNNFSNIQPSREVKRFPIPALLGDVIQQGRTGTYIRHSFNPVDKNGVFRNGYNTT